MSTTPTRLQLKKKSGLLVLHYADGSCYELGAEFLRVHSPSAEVRGHGRGQAVLQTGKRGVGFKGIEAVGNYAVRLLFDDGHDSGIFSWDYLHHLCTEQDTLWQAYLDALQQAGARRDPLPPDTQVITIDPIQTRTS